MNFYDGKIDVITKQDQSPLTIADLEANKYIVEQLKKLSGIPIVSEENDEVKNQEIIKDPLFWLVDPLDGTKSFIKKTGEFTVNIALIENKKPIGGAIFVPAKNTGYFVAEDGNSYKQIDDKLPTQINARVTPEDGAVVVASASHRTDETNEFIDSLPKVKDVISAASSLKLCLIAEGQADIYPRFGRTMQWDIAAGHAILNASGGSVQNIDNSEFIYRDNELANPFFIAKGLTS